MSKQTSNILTLDEVCQLIGLKKGQFLEDYDDFYIENNYCQCSEELQNEGKCECGFEDQRSDLFHRYTNVVEGIAEKLLNEHGLTLVKNEKKFNWRIVPEKNWLDSSSKVMATIEGYGMFGYNGNVREFLRSGPYTARESVLQHTHWLKEYYSVYGSPDAQSQLDRAMRY